MTGKCPLCGKDGRLTRDHAREIDLDIFHVVEVKMGEDAALEEPKDFEFEE